MSELTPTVSNQQSAVYHPAMSVLDLPPEQKVSQITSMANILKDIINKQNMVANINGKDYVTVDGWTTLGSLLNVIVQEAEVHQIDKGWYAKVNIVTRGSNTIVSTASAICTRDEKSWTSRPEFSLRSMAVTRATGKAYRLAFSWIVNLAGYNGTPAEEMEEFLPKEDDYEKATYTHTVPSQEQETEIRKYDKHDREMQDKLLAYMEKRDVPFQYHDDVGNALHGKIFSQNTIEKLIKEVVK